MGYGRGCEGCVKLVWLSGLPGGVFVLFLCVGVCPFRLVGSCCVFLFAGVDAATVRCFGRAAELCGWRRHLAPGAWGRPCHCLKCGQWHGRHTLLYKKVCCK